MVGRQRVPCYLNTEPLHTTSTKEGETRKRGYNCDQKSLFLSVLETLKSSWPLVVTFVITGHVLILSLQKNCITTSVIVIEYIPSSESDLGYYCTVY